METEYTAGEISRLAGFEKPWMLGHLEREGTFVREHQTDRRHGRARKYTFSDLLILRAINRMLEMGARPARIRDVIHKLSKLSGFSGTREAAESLVTQLGVKLFIGKNDVYLMSSENELIDLNKKGQLAFGFMIDMHLVAKELTQVTKLYGAQKINLYKTDKDLLEKLCKQAGI
jgi:DNA-binding transcriptional MerR regulator